MRKIFLFIIPLALLTPAFTPNASSKDSVCVTFLDVPRETDGEGDAGSRDIYMRRVEKYWGRGGIGDSILIQTGERSILIDGGLWTKGRSVVIPYLKKQGIERLDTVILTHQHGDHYGGLTEVLQAVPTGEIITNGLAHSAKAYFRFMKAVEASGAKYRVVKGGEKFDWGNGVRAEVVQVGGRGIPTDDYNNNSVVIRLTCGRVNFLFTGDMEEEEEGELLASRRDIRSQILKVGHHGSSSSSTYDFLKAVTPGIAVISIGSGNRFGLPHQSVIDRIEAFGAEVYRTDLDGTVRICTDGSTWTVEAEKERPRKTVKKRRLNELFYRYESEASVFRRKKDFPRATLLYRRALAVEPDEVKARSWLGYCYKKMGLKDQAVREFERVLSSEPCDPYANLHMGLIKYRDDRELALKYFEDYLRCHPTSRMSFLAEEKIGQIHAGRGWDYKKEGKIEEALSEFEKAITVCRRLPFPHLQLGLLYADRDRRRARAELMKYLELEPDGRYAKMAREKLREIKDRDDR